MLNGVMIKQFLKRDGRTRTWLAAQLGISSSLLEKMLNGHLPKEETVDALVEVIGVPRSVLVTAEKKKLVVTA